MIEKTVKHFPELCWKDKRKSRTYSETELLRGVTHLLTNSLSQCADAFVIAIRFKQTIWKCISIATHFCLSACSIWAILSFGKYSKFDTFGCLFEMDVKAESCHYQSTSIMYSKIAIIRKKTTGQKQTGCLQNLIRSLSRSSIQLLLLSWSS